MGNNMQSRKEVIQMQWREIYVLCPRDNLSNEEEYVIRQGYSCRQGNIGHKQYEEILSYREGAGFIIARTEH